MLETRLLSSCSGLLGIRDVMCVCRLSSLCVSASACVRRHGDPVREAKLYTKRAHSIIYGHLVVCASAERGPSLSLVATKLWQHSGQKRMWVAWIVEQSPGCQRIEGDVKSAHVHRAGERERAQKRIHNFGVTTCSFVSLCCCCCCVRL